MYLEDGCSGSFLGSLLSQVDKHTHQQSVCVVMFPGVFIPTSYNANLSHFCVKQVNLSRMSPN